MTYLPKAIIDHFYRLKHGYIMLHASQAWLAIQESGLAGTYALVAEDSKCGADGMLLDVTEFVRATVFVG